MMTTKCPPCVFCSDVYEEFFNPAMAAQTLLHAAASKRREVLQKTMGFIIQVLTSPNLDPKHKSGAMHMVGSLAEVLLQVNITFCLTTGIYRFALR